MAPLADPGDCEDAVLQGLLLRSRAALQALSDGKVRTANGLDSVRELQQRMKSFLGQLELQGSGIDLREVQESIVEHAAMYANCPEVLGGMLQLVFCLDHVRGWLEQRDLAVQDALSQLDTLQRNFEDCSAHITQVGMEVRTFTKQASSRELDLVLHGRGEAGSPSITGASPRISARGASPKGFMMVSQNGKGISVDLQALEAEEDMNSRLEELKRENENLQRRLAESAAETAAARSAAEAAQNAAEQTAAAAAQVAAARSSQPASIVLQELRPESSPLEVLEKLEPMLAGLPVGVVPGMSELQEEACEVYGHLRQLLIVAARGEPAEDQPSLPMPQMLPALPPLAVAGVGGFHRIPAPLNSMRSRSTGTSEDPPDTWRATVISDPHRGIGAYGGTFNNAYASAVQETYGGVPWANPNRLC